jgi:hypothetical protein
MFPFLCTVPSQVLQLVPVRKTDITSQFEPKRMQCRTGVNDYRLRLVVRERITSYHCPLFVSADGSDGGCCGGVTVENIEIVFAAVLQICFFLSLLFFLPLIAGTSTCWPTYSRWQEERNLTPTVLSN